MVALSDTLVVPIDLAALCVGETDVNGSPTHPYGTADFSRLAPDFALLPYAADGIAHNPGPYLSAKALPQTFQSASTPLDVGIHLHWALPAALSHGAQKDDGSIGFPPAPNRWLVVRIATNAQEPRTPGTCLKAWVLESDRLWDGTLAADMPVQNRMSLDVPISPRPNVQPNISWRTLGRVFDHAGWREDPDADRARLTALGYGEATYAATYQLCPNVFGFWDTLADLDPAAFPPDSTRVSYLLAGWFAEAGDDPLTRIPYPEGADARQKLAAIAAAYGWVFPLEEGGEVPARTVYASLLTDIPWDRQTHYIEKREPAAGGLKIAVGNTTPEALSALIAADPDLAGEKNVELILNAFQLGLLTRLELPGGLVDLEEALHKSAFAAISDSSLWRIDPASGVKTEPGRGGPLLSELPPAIGDALNALNLAQAELDRLRRDIASLRSRIFADWARYMRIAYPVPPTGGGTITANEARQFITNEIAALNTLVAQQGEAEQEVERRRAELHAEIGPDYALTSTDGARFLGPADPVLLFSGADVDPSTRYEPRGLRDENGDLVCRVGTRLLSALVARNGGSDFTIGADALPSVPANPALPFGAAVAALQGEAFLVDPVQSAVLAAAVARLGGAGNPAVADFGAFRATVEAAQAGLYGGVRPDTVVFTGTPPSLVAFKRWSAPWIPIILQWQTEHYPNALPPYPADFVTANYGFDAAGVDLVFNGTIPVDPENVRTYQGTIVLTHNTDINIRQQIEDFIANFPDSDMVPELKEILAHLHLAMQAQALSGFDQALLMLARVLQMEVSDPLGILQGQFFANFTNVTVKNAVLRHNIDTPLGNNTFSPLRNGGFRIARVRIVDAFGQPLDLERPPVIRAASLVPPQESEELINLPLRITQPVRFAFNWLSAGNDAVELNSHPATTPVCGWVLFNRLDQALMIYDEIGTALGSLNLLGPLWQGAPGNQQAYGRPIEEVFADANPHLRAFALGLAGAADPRAYLADILRTIDRSLGFISPDQNQPFDALSVLIGRPLALARAVLDLEPLGLPAMDQSLAAFRAAIDGKDPLQREDGGAPAVRVPVVLGAFDDVDDGLVGYFIDDGAAAAYHTFYAEAADPSWRHGVVPPASDQITLATSRESRPVVVSMLLDPNAPIHARTGLLPLVELGIPSSMIADDLARIAVTFLTTPVLTSGLPQMPVPDESGYVWKWVTQVAGAGEWSVEPVVGGTDVSLLRQRAQEGWLKLEHAPDSPRARRRRPRTA
ncbi:hypothetical protein [Ancylobacter lacus]|uniref:hypothetical protein n=1 Tax=Ancylobacter lacus TaxID=2579970 RepID=UPI001BCC136E|nr:hypothetical protein [Ancylobacter lacus]MBS7539522.1 hypothetical protein [Ancylobacter lacus]